MEQENLEQRIEQQGIANITTEEENIHQFSDFFKKEMPTDKTMLTQFVQ